MRVNAKCSMRQDHIFTIRERGQNIAWARISSSRRIVIRIGIISLQLDSSERGCVVRLCFGFSRFSNHQQPAAKFNVIIGTHLIAYFEGAEAIELFLFIQFRLQKKPESFESAGASFVYFLIKIVSAPHKFNHL